VSVCALGTLGIDVSDLAAWERFASSILGLAVGDRGDDGTLYLQMDGRHHRLAVHPGSADDLAYLGWDVATSTELSALSAQLNAAGIVVNAGDAALCARRFVDELVWCIGPSGIRNEFSVGAREAVAAFRSPRALSGFLAGEQGVGHAVMIVDDEEDALHFYRDLLGLRVSDFIDFEREPGVPVHMTFLHCNARHHSLAFMRRPGAPKRISHLMIEARSLDDVGSTYSLCEREDVPIAMTLGRHTNDEMFSFYMVTPSGFNLEFGYGGKAVDDANWTIQYYNAASVWGHRRQPLPAAVDAARQPEGMKR
jgi:2,3-dihydroxybiphenyl 1,2-dioxygenase